MYSWNEGGTSHMDSVSCTLSLSREVEMLSLCTCIPIYFLLSIEGVPFCRGFEPNTQNPTPKAAPFYIASAYRNADFCPAAGVPPPSDNAVYQGAGLVGSGESFTSTPSRETKAKMSPQGSSQGLRAAIARIARTPCQ